MSFKWHVTGIQETISRLATFQRRFRTQTLRKAGNEASKIALAAMKSNAPVAKPENGQGGSLKKSLGRKVVVRNDRLWFGAGPRTKWLRTVAKKNRYWRDKQGRIRKASWKWMRKEQPSRRAHLSERKTHFIARTQAGSRSRQEAAIVQVLGDAMASA